MLESIGFITKKTVLGAACGAAVGGMAFTGYFVLKPDKFNTFSGSPLLHSLYSIGLSSIQSQSKQETATIPLAMFVGSYLVGALIGGTCAFTSAVAQEIFRLNKPAQPQQPN